MNSRFCHAHPLPAHLLPIDSLYFLGLLKLYGISVSPDAGKALEYMRKAAELRHLEAMAALGVMLLHGRGRPSTEVLYYLRGEIVSEKRMRVIQHSALCNRVVRQLNLHVFRRHQPVAPSLEVDCSPPSSVR